MQAKFNTFGDVRAEFDHQMLDNSFFEGQDYKSLFESKDRFIVVGRRGTGKSALTYRLKKDWSDRKFSTIVIAPNEEQVIGLRPVAKLFGNTVSRVRAGLKLAWRYALLMEMTVVLYENYKTKKDVEARPVLLAHLKAWNSKSGTCIDRIKLILKDALKSIDDEEERISELSTQLQLNRVIEDVTSIVHSSDKEFIILIDRLDEGYEPDQIGIGIVNGIIYGVDDLRAAFHKNLRAVVFVRDNIFRAMQVEDKDFSRNLEAQVLRLHWDQQELFYMAAKRIRQVFNVDRESDVKAWNAITSNELHGREGFKSCLKLTLYRPRDVIALLNSAFYQAQRQGRSTLIEDDFVQSAKEISNTRFDDLSKEYESVMPGVGILVSAFANGDSKLDWGSTIKIIDRLMGLDGYESPVAQNFKILGSADEAIKALYGIGFFGLYDKQHGNFIFSHDGKKPDKVFSSKDILMIHPCYWAALNLKQDTMKPEDAQEIYDEYEISIASHTAEQRSRLLGQLISELQKIPTGDDGAAQFEDWCKRAVEIAFARQLSNFQLKPNAQATQRRDIVATNQGIEGFWKRILKDYSTRQVVFEVKNYESIGIDEYRQVHSYLGKEYGKLGFIICRDSQAGLTKGRELDAFREFYNKDNVIMKFTASQLVAILSKLRNPEKVDAGNKLLESMLDTHIRMYANGQTDAKKSKPTK